jgi:hypothetical protein
LRRIEELVEQNLDDSQIETIARRPPHVEGIDAPMKADISLRGMATQLSRDPRAGVHHQPLILFR